MISPYFLPLLAAASDSPWETASFYFTVLCGISAGIWAVVVWRREATWRRQDHVKELKQRAEELRWKQAELARGLLDDIFDWAPSRNAWDMVDGILKLKDEDGEKIEISENAMPRALKLTEVQGKKVLKDSPDEEQQGEDAFVRDCFDSLFYYIERLEHSVRIGVVRFEDLAAPSGYYINLMAARKTLFREYSQFIGFDAAVAFMNRFPEWSNREG